MLTHLARAFDVMLDLTPQSLAEGRIKRMQPANILDETSSQREPSFLLTSFQFPARRLAHPSADWPAS